MVAQAIRQRECKVLGLCTGEGRSRVEIDKSARRCGVSADGIRVVGRREKKAAKDRRGENGNRRDGRGVDNFGNGGFYDSRIVHGRGKWILLHKLACF